MNPFTVDTKIQDVASNVRHELYIINALLMSLEVCSDVQFDGCKEEEASLIDVTRERLGQLITHAENVAKGEAS